MKEKSRTRVVVGMSGGVDSSVAALLLKQQGYDVIGVFMKNWDEKDEYGNCTSDDDFADVRDVCEQINIPYFSVDFVKEYWDKVFTYFLEEYKNGRTPNPDILCNKEVKFKLFLEKALNFGADYMATGHYAGIRNNNGIYELTKSKDQGKDQTYFLSQLNQYQLSKAMFPLETIDKGEIREIARKHKLKVAEKKDSTGICFIGERNFKEFISNYLPAKPGEIVDLDSHQVIGKHDGLMYYTLGQRKGLGIGGMGTGEPWFVADKDLDKNHLIVVQGENHPALFSNELITEEFHWIKGSKPNLPLKCNAKFRYRQSDQGVTVLHEENNKIRIVFDKPQKAITPGQSAVLYDNDVCLGGGVIETVIKE